MRSYGQVFNYTVRFNNSITYHSSRQAALAYARKWTRFYKTQGHDTTMAIYLDGSFICTVTNGYKVNVPCVSCGINRVTIIHATCSSCVEAR